MFQGYSKYFYVVFALAILGCAKRGTINGGLKDTLSPVLRNAIPKNYTTDFKGNTIKLNFDEYVKLKNVNKQLIVSPPMEKTPEITPQVASKSINIKLNDTLLPNTTYSLNFGQSIEDNNEGNPYRQFKYVFSTGPYIDSLSLSGSIKDAYTKKTDNFVSVMLYEVDDQYSDSIVYKKNPRYVTNTLDSTTVFKLENLKAGKYLLVALQDQNSNYKLDPKTEKVGFRKQFVTVPNDSLFEIALFRQQNKFKAFKPSQSSGNSAFVGYTGSPKDVKFKLRKGNDEIRVIATKVPKKDSLQIWFKPPSIEKNKVDSVAVEVQKGDYLENFVLKLKNQKKDTLSLKPIQGSVLPLGEKYILSSGIPLTGLDLSKMKLTNKDSTAVKFTAAYDEPTMELRFDFVREELQKYKLELLPGAVTDFMETANDTLVYRFETKNASDYGNLKLNLENVRQYPIIVELTDKNENVQYSYYSENDAEIDFTLIKPDTYTIRIIYDENKNWQWDAGDFILKKQSEEVIYFPKEVDVRANWDVVQPFNLKP